MKIGYKHVEYLNKITDLAYCEAGEKTCTLRTPWFLYKISS